MNTQSLKISGFLCATLVGVAFACVASGAFAAGAPDQDADMQAVNSFRLNDKVIAKYTAVIKNLIALQKQHPEVEKQLDKDSDIADKQTIAQAVAMVDKYPLARDAITRSGMSVTDYITCSLALVQASMRAMAIGQGASALSVPSGAATDNLHYYLANKAKFDALSQLMSQMTSDSSQ